MKITGKLLDDMNKSIMAVPSKFSWVLTLLAGPLLKVSLQSWDCLVEEIKFITYFKEHQRNRILWYLFLQLETSQRLFLCIKQTQGKSWSIGKIWLYWSLIGIINVSRLLSSGRGESSLELLYMTMLNKVVRVRSINFCYHFIP